MPRSTVSILRAIFLALVSVFANRRTCEGAVAGSQHFIIESTGSAYSQLSTPSVNGLGDATFRATLANNNRQVMASIWNRQTGASPPAPYASHNVQSSAGVATILSPYPDINDNRTVAFSRTQSPGDEGSVRRRAYDSVLKTYSAPSESIAGWDLTSPYTGPFRNPASLVSIANNGTVSFPSSAENFFGVEYSAVFGSSVAIGSPASAIVIEEEIFGINDLDSYVDASSAGWVVRGSNSLGDLGIFRVTTRGSSDRVTPVGTFTSLGNRPSVNDSGTIAFAGVNAAGKSGAYLSFSNNGTLYDTTLRGSAPQTLVNVTDKVAVNRFNQIAYLGTNAAGKKALYSTNLGATREIIAVDDMLNGSPVTDLRLQDGISSGGSLTYLASTAAGQSVVRTERAYTQGALANSASTTPWAGLGYLLDGHPESGVDDGKTIGKHGCNLTTTANILSYYGVDVTPGELQAWIVNKHHESTGSYLPGGAYITEQNDFMHNVVLEYSRSRQSPVLVQWDKVHPTPQTNFETLVNELRNGRPVKIRVPNGSTQDGHFIMAYGLSNPLELAADVTADDILVHDPGNPSRKVATAREINTLADYSAHLVDIASPAAGTNWLANRQRLHLYKTTTNPNASQVTIQIHSPVEIVITSPSGSRVGVDPASGVFEEIAGATYFEESSYQSIDEDGLVWSNDEPMKTLVINDPEPGNYQLEIIGTGSGAYNVVFGGGDLLGLSLSTLSGVTTMGQREEFSFSVTPQFPPALTGDFNGDSRVDAADLAKWKTDFGVNDQSDADNDLDSDGADFLAWQRHFGTSAVATVPEPIFRTQWLASCLSCGMMILRRKLGMRPAG